MDVFRETELKEQAESSISYLTEDLHRQGLNYQQILGLFLDKSVTLFMQAQAEYFLKGGK